jgi:hypothetical protein
VIIGLSFESFVFSLSIAAALCIGSLSYGAAVYGSRIKDAKLFLLNAGLLALISATLRVTLNVAWRTELWSWLHRIYRVSWLSECSAIILGLIATGLMTIEVAGKVGGDAMQKRYQWSMIGGASVLVAANTVHFLRPVDCADCFFPYGLPFTLFTEGGYGGGGGLVWAGIIANAVLIPAFAIICTLLWNRLAK